ncbi:glutaminyl-peptide cyclotransferase [Gemmatimonas sp.]|uniref:glutaminyl-peptide cyclotransferase n=1 Tax=Gemmatimonas sp. TaxID=1962908 RepID=UPI0039839B82
MAILSSIRRSRTASAVILFGTVAFVSTAGAFGACGGDRGEASAASGDTTGTVSARTPTYSYEVVQSYPHDPRAFTQGLVWHDDRLFESTGQVGQSTIREVELNSGRVIRQQELEAPHFGEGIVLLGDQLFQITWTTGKAFVYDWKTFKRTGQFTYEGEGWGLTTDGTAIIMSNGTSSLVWRDPATFTIQKTITVSDHGTPVSQLNELEWVKGEIWANLWQSEQIARIDPTTGNVTGWIDLAGILPPIDRTGNEDVMNGIAYDATRDRLLVTGKLWSKLYEIKLKQRS